jgi:cbb3-type cytochrome oxidase maturation protein
MEILYLLIPLSLVLVFLVAWVFFWSVSHGQFDDLDSPAKRILEED